MCEEPRYPTLVERALRYLRDHAGEGSAADLGAHLFGAVPSGAAGGNSPPGIRRVGAASDGDVLTSVIPDPPFRAFSKPGAGPWATLLASVLGADKRIVSVRPGYWALANRQPSPLRLAEAAALAHRALESPTPGERPPTTSGIPPSTVPALDFVALGVVTDGPKPYRHRVVQIAAIIPEATLSPDAMIGDYSTWVRTIRPDQPRRLPGYLIELGLSAEELEDAPTFTEVAAELLEFIGGRPILGLDVGLAVAFLQFELRRAGWPPLDNELRELAELASLAGRSFTSSVLPRGALPGKPSLDRLAVAFGVSPGDPRRLASRTRAAAEIGRALAFDGGGAAAGPAVTVGSVGREMRVDPTENASPIGPADSLAATRRRLLLDVSASRLAPTTPGVYLFRDLADRVLYVGKATHLRTRLTQYLTSDLARERRMSGLAEATSRIETRPTATELEARLLEARLIGRYAPRFNVQRSAGFELVYLQRELAALGPAVRGGPRRPPWAGTAEAFTSEVTGECVGPLSASAARDLLDRARNEFRLSSGRNRADWPARATAAWAMVRSSMPTSPVGPLTAADLASFALVAPWPANDPDDIAVDGDLAESEDASASAWPPAQGPPSAGEESGPSAGSSLVAAGAPAAGGAIWQPWELADRDRDAEIEARAAAVTNKDLANGDPQDDRQGFGAELAAAERPDRRVLLFDRSGWLGGLTIDADSPAEWIDAEIERLGAVEPAAERALPLRELGVALRFAELHPEVAVALPNEPAARLRAACWPVTVPNVAVRANGDHEAMTEG